MTRLNLPLFLATLLAGASMVAMEGEEDPDTQEHGSEYYSRGQAGYRSAPNVGYGRPGAGGYGFPGFGFGFPYPTTDKPLDALDKLYKRLDTVKDELKSGAEILGNLEARMSLVKDILTRDILGEEDGADREDTVQNARLDLLEAQLDDLDRLFDQLDRDENNLSDMNRRNADNQEELNIVATALRRNDLEQAGRLEVLNVKENRFKDKLLTILDNELIVRGSSNEMSDERLKIMIERENSIACEVGQVTLDKDDRRVDYMFQNSFSSAPQVTHALCGYDFNVDVRPDSYYNSYYKEPNALGVLILADPSPSGVTLEMIDQSFGDTSIVSADVCFQACSVYTGQFQVPERDEPIDPAPTVPDGGPDN